MWRHYQSNSNEKPYTCSKCDRNFESETDLLEHERIHTEEKPYRCSQCDKNFEFATDLLEHERIHTEEKPYNCLQCDRNFNVAMQNRKSPAITWNNPLRRKTIQLLKM